MACGQPCAGQGVKAHRQAWRYLPAGFEFLIPDHQRMRGTPGEQLGAAVDPDEFQEFSGSLKKLGRRENEAQGHCRSVELGPQRLDPLPQSGLIPLARPMPHHPVWMFHGRTLAF